MPRRPFELQVLTLNSNKTETVPMNFPSLQIENLGKEYQLGVREGGYSTFREAIVNSMKAPWRRLRKLSGHFGERERFWALQDVSFDVEPGEVVGIIGRNGAGKSTLLKVLSQITEPTTGQVRIRGRVASLLEVGTGFHPELTGRENIFLNGAILGMSAREVKRKFDAIVEFSGVGEFLDTPVKRYSSGMHVRLAFSVAAHLDPDILIVDEVLAVGDSEFQAKCLGRMNEVASDGRTVLFVSHNMSTVQALCNRAGLLVNGRLAMYSDTQSVISQYLKTTGTSSVVDLRNHPGRARGCSPVVTEFQITDGQSHPVDYVRIGSDVRFQLQLNPSRSLQYVRVAIRIFNNLGQRIITCHNEYQHPVPLKMSRPGMVSCTLKNCRLAPGNYSVELQIDEYREVLDRIESGLAFEVVSSDVYGTGRQMPAHTTMIFPDLEWCMPESS